MYCLANKDQTTTSSPEEKLKLLRNGLGEKRVAFPVSASSDAVKEVLYRYHIYAISA